MMSLESKYQRLFYNDFYNADLGMDVEPILRNLSQNDTEFTEAVSKDDYNDSIGEFYLDIFDDGYTYFDEDERNSDYNTLQRIYNKYTNEFNNLENEL